MSHATASSSALPPPTLESRMEPATFVVPATATLPEVARRIEPITDWKAIFKDALTYPTRGRWVPLLLPVLCFTFAMWVGGFFGLQSVLTPLMVATTVRHHFSVSDGYEIIVQICSVLVFMGSLFLLLIPLSYAATFFVRVVHGTMAGKDHLPNWPSNSDVVEDFGEPLSIILAAIVSAIPVITYQSLTPVSNYPREWPGLVPLSLDWVGAAIFSVAVTGYATEGSLWNGWFERLKSLIADDRPALVVMATSLFGVRLAAYAMFTVGFEVSSFSVPLGCLILAWFVPVYGRLVGAVCRRHADA